MRFKITCRCIRCGHKWHRFTKNVDSPDPACPNLACGEESVPIGMDLTSNRAPATIGANVRVKAVDETARMVMEDYGMTDLRSDVREHETAAPKIAPHLQKQADNYFGGPAKGRGGVNLRSAVNNAMSGRLRDGPAEQSSIGAVHSARYRPPVKVLASHS